MESLTFRTNDYDHSTYADVLNCVCNPFGVILSANSKTNCMYVFDRAYYNTLAVFSLSSLASSKTITINIDANRSMTINFNPKFRFTSITVEDKENGRALINFDFNTKNIDFTSDDAIIYSPVIEVDNLDIFMYKDQDRTLSSNISYRSINNLITFSPSNSSGHLSISRSGSSQTTLVLTKSDDKYVQEITSIGDENEHKIAAQFALSEKPFDVVYKMVGVNSNFKTEIQKNRNADFRHFSNVKVINNQNVRKIIDSVMEAYKKIFQYDDYKNGVLGGYLFNAYINGEPNTKKIGDNLLRAVGLDEKENTRNRKKDKHSSKK